MTEDNNAHSEIKATDVKSVHDDKHNQKDETKVIASEHHDSQKQKLDNSDNLGDNITKEQAAQFKNNLLNSQRNEMEGVTPEQQMAEAQKVQTEQQIAQVKAQIAQLAAQREKIVQETLQKPAPNHVGATVMGMAIPAVIITAAEHLGNPIKKASGIIQDIGKDAKIDISEVVGKVVNDDKGKNEIVAGLTVAAENIKSYVNKEAVTQTLKTTPNIASFGDNAGDVAKKLANIVEKIDPSKIEETKILDEVRKIAGKGATNEVVDGLMQSVVETVTQKNNTLNGDHVEALKKGIEATMQSKPISGAANNISNFVRNKGGVLLWISGTVIVGGAIAYGIDKVLKSGEEKEREQAKEAVGKYSAAILEGQKAVAQLTMSSGGRG